MRQLIEKSQFIAAKIKELRKTFGYSQRELGKKGKISGATLSKIEKGNVTPSLNVLFRLSQIFNITVAELTNDFPLTHDELLIFSREWGKIRDLNDTDKELLQSIIERLLK